MPSPKSYLNDRFILLLASILVFLALIGSTLIILRLAGGVPGQDYIVEYRANLGINRFKSGGILQFLAFIFFFIFVAVLHVGLSVRIYHLRRYLALAVLSLGILLLTMGIVVSNALLVLQ